MENKNHSIPQKRINVPEFTLILVFIGTLIVGYLSSHILPLFNVPTNLSLFIVITGIPCYYFLYRWIGFKQTIFIIISLVSLVFLIESLGIITGLPYGHFFYTDRLGFKIFGLVPWSVPFAFVPLLLGTMAISSKLFKTPWRMISFSAILLVLFDLILDPALVLLHIWVWISPGMYYGVPILNFIGWFFTGIITSTILLALLHRVGKMNPEMPPLISISLFLSLGFWTSFSLWNRLIIPFLICLILTGLMASFFISSTQHRKKVSLVSVL